MGRSPPYSSPESNIEIKVQPRHTDIHPIVSPPPNRYGQNRQHGPPPPMSYQPYVEKKWFSWIVPSIFVVNIVLFVISMDLNNCPQRSNSCVGASFLGRFSFQPTHENPLLGPSSTTLQSMGALEVNKVVGQREIWRLASCMWLHAGVFHLLANMLSLLFVGISLEREFGFVRIFLLYVICGIGGSLLSSLFASTTISVGASGALFGLLGAMLSELITNWTLYENKFGALFTLLLITAINLAVGILPHVDNFAHLGGFTTGFLLGFILLLRPQFGWISQRHVSPGSLPSKSKSKYKTYQYVLLIVSLLLLIAGFAIGLTLLLKKFDGNKHCSWCHYLRCIPTPFWSCTEARCSSIQYGNQYNLTCIQNQRSGSYVLEYNNSTTDHIKKLCVELCR